MSGAPLEDGRMVAANETVTRMVLEIRNLRADLNRERTAKHNAVRQAEIWAMEARTQQAIVRDREAERDAARDEAKQLRAAARARPVVTPQNPPEVENALDVLGRLERFHDSDARASVVHVAALRKYLRDVHDHVVDLRAEVELLKIELFTRGLPLPAGLWRPQQGVDLRPPRDVTMPVPPCGGLTASEMAQRRVQELRPTADELLRQCFACSTYFGSESQLINHLGAGCDGELNLSRCGLCGYFASSGDDLRGHKRNIHCGDPLTVHSYGNGPHAISLGPKVDAAALDVFILGNEPSARDVPLAQSTTCPVCSYGNGQHHRLCERRIPELPPEPPADTPLQPRP